MTHWTAGLRSDNPSATNLISMLDVIGADRWTGDGVTANRIAAALRRAGAGHLQLRTDRDWLMDVVRFVGERRRAGSGGASR